MTGSHHISVMAEEVVAALNPRAGGIYLDGTFGGGGYTRALLKTAGVKVVGLDRDPAAIARGSSLVREADGRLALVHCRFSQMEEAVAALALTAVDGVALDLGLSSDQLDDAARGFSFQVDGPLDMRMGAEGPNAADLVNGLSERELADVIYTYGEEHRSRAIARAIVAARGETPITRTGALAQIVAKAVGGRGADKIHPATRTFQALRIAVNDELGELARGLAAAERLLAPAGRLAVVAFHSLEDRIVKRFLTLRSGGEGAPSRHQPMPEAGPSPSFRLLSRGARKPSAAEIAENPRARSARLRSAERTEAPAHPLDLAALGLPPIALDGVL